MRSSMEVSKSTLAGRRTSFEGKAGASNRFQARSRCYCGALAAVVYCLGVL